LLQVLSIFFSFPGLTPTDDVLGLLKLLSSIRPDLAIAAQIAFDGGYDPCNNATFFLGLDTKRKKRAILQICDKDFVADEDNGYCYLNSQNIKGPQTFLVGQEYCTNHSADLLTFENDAQVVGFLQLYSSGEYVFVY
jgi:hypothetical protein